MADNKNVITDGVKKLLLAGVGAVALTAEKADEIVDALVEKGEITVEQGKELNKELKRKFEEKKESGDNKFDVDDFLNKLSSEDIDKLKQALKDKE